MDSCPQLLTLAVKSSWNIYRIDMIFFFCVQRYCTHVVLKLSSKPNIYVQLIISHVRKNLCAFKCRHILLAFITTCPEIILSSKSIQLQIEIHLDYQVHITPWYNGRWLLFWDINRDFYLLQFSCCLSPSPLKSVPFTALEQKADAAQNTGDSISEWIFRKHKRSNNLKT